jgi:hypothetical protein
MSRQVVPAAAAPYRASGLVQWTIASFRGGVKIGQLSGADRTLAGRNLHGAFTTSLKTLIRATM